LRKQGAGRWGRIDPGEGNKAVAYKMTATEFSDYLESLAGEFLFSAPVVCPGKGACMDTDPSDTKR
jgi:hypothetical protein